MLTNIVFFEYNIIYGFIDWNSPWFSVPSQYLSVIQKKATQSFTGISPGYTEIGRN